MRSKLLVFFAAVLWFTTASAQQDPQYTMFMFNRHVLNPAYAGAFGSVNVTSLGRSQWVGIEGAPNTATLSAHGYSRMLHGGIGAYIIGDKLGTMSTTGIKASYAFHAVFGDDPTVHPRLQIGVGGGIYQKALRAEWRYNTDFNPNDPRIGPNGTQYAASTMVPDLDAGIYFRIPLGSVYSSAYPQDKFYIGASVTHILEPDLEDLLQGTNVNSEVTNLSRHIVATAGFTIPIDQNIYLQPSVGFRMAGPLMQYDINANLYISPMVFGLSYRGGDAISGILGFNASTQMFIGYAYDYTMSGLASSVTGSHEVIISYTFPSKSLLNHPIKGVREDNDGSDVIGR